VRNLILTATGKKGYGKTTLVRALVEPCRRAIFADPEGKWPARPGDVEVRHAVELLDYLADIGAADPAVPFRAIYRDDADVMGRTVPALAFGVRNLTLVIDELAWLCTPWELPAYLRRLLQFGRERRVNLVGTTREPQEVHDLFFSQADLVMLFHTDPGNGLDRLRRRYPELASKLASFDIGQYHAYGDPGALALLGREGLALLG
jgi:hypothetical protein